MAEISIVGKYEVRREIGRGAMGVVYEAFDPLIKRVVALKTIRAEQLAAEESSTVIARFRREAQAAGRLSHPNIVPIYDFGEDAGVWYIAMEYVKGRELKEAFDANERFATADIVRIMSQILEALEYSHRQGVVHRDIKPANVFLLADGTVKVADFGIAHVEASNLTQVGMVLGTPSYMSPEQIMGLPVDGRTDLFSAGVILYQFLTGERPFAGSATTTMQKVLKEDPMPPSILNVLAPAGMDAVVRKALAKRPEERFQSAAEFAAAIRAAAPAPTPLGSDATLITTADPTLIARAVAAPGNKNAVFTADVPPASPPPVPPAQSAPGAGPSAKNSRTAALAFVAIAALLAIGAAAWFAYQRLEGGGTIAQLPPPQQTASAPAQLPAPAPAGMTSSSKLEPGTMLISAVGLIDPSDPRYSADKSLLQSDLRADSRSQLVGKALALFVDTKSLAKNYDVLKDRLLAKSGSFINTVVREDEPRVGKDGLMHMTTQAVVNVKAVQKSLNQMSRDERVELIRVNGDPKISVRISVRDVDQPDAPSQPSPVAENLLKERIKSFGFRTWSEGAPGADDPKKLADFQVLGEAKIKRLSMRLEASGVTMTKYALTSWTVKGIDRETGEEIYYNTALPKGVGSWASEEEALRAIGAKIADEFSREFFLEHANVTGQKVTLIVQGMPDRAAEDMLARELVGLPEVITASPRAPASPRIYDLQVAGSGAPGDLVASAVLGPLNGKLGQACFSLGSVSGDQVSIVLDSRCADPAVISRLETNPPAGLYGAPASRQKSVVKNPETLKKLMI